MNSRGQPDEFITETIFGGSWLTISLRWSAWARARRAKPRFFTPLGTGWLAKNQVRAESSSSGASIKMQNFCLLARRLGRGTRKNLPAAVAGLRSLVTKCNMLNIESLLLFSLATEINGRAPLSGPAAWRELCCCLILPELARRLALNLIEPTWPRGEFGGRQSARSCMISYQICECRVRLASIPSPSSSLLHCLASQLLCEYIISLPIESPQSRQQHTLSLANIIEPRPPVK